MVRSWKEQDGAMEGCKVDGETVVGGTEEGTIEGVEVDGAAEGTIDGFGMDGTEVGVREGDTVVGWPTDR